MAALVGHRGLLDSAVWRRCACRLSLMREQDERKVCCADVELSYLSFLVQHVLLYRFVGLPRASPNANCRFDVFVISDI